MAIILFDNQFRKKLFPLTVTQAVADLRMGILKRKEWWQLTTGMDVQIHTEAYLQPLYGNIAEGEHFWIDAAILPTANLVEQIMQLQSSAILVDDFGLVAGNLSILPTSFQAANAETYGNKKLALPTVKRITQPQHLFQLNEACIQQDFALVTKGRQSITPNETNQVIQAAAIFIEPGAEVNYSLLNASTGPIYIGKNATIMEGCIIRGPFALLDNATLKMGTKVYGATTIGVQSVGGGEIKNAILSDYSNKAHDGYLGDSVLGEWCNMGAGTSNSNIKNTAGDVKLWNYDTNTYESAGLKCGVIMGSFSRAAINSSINTGSSIGVCCNVFGEGLLPTLINHFSWGTKNASIYQFDKAINDINNWMGLKGKSITDAQITMLKYIFDQYQSYLPT